MLLRENELTIGELAEKMGFVEQNSFSRFFKKETGMTPMEYRNSQAV
ncbi:MAG: helix-turn-helix domain-containing protein [Bacteroidales bacterium]|nr:helix-turn-helix domain-containing protein [Bacteroidales bacterium]